METPENDPMGAGIIHTEETLTAAAANFLTQGFAPFIEKKKKRGEGRNVKFVHF